MRIRTDDEVERLKEQLEERLKELDEIAAPYNQLKVDIARLNNLITLSDSVSDQKILQDKVKELTNSLADLDLPRVIARRQQLSKSIDELTNKITALDPTLNGESPSILPNSKQSKA